MERNTLIAALLLVAVVAISGCTSGGDAPEVDAGDTSGSFATLTMKITDAPPELNIEKAIVTISKVQVHIAGSADEDPNATTETGWSVIVEEAKTFDLIAIKGVKEMLGTAQLTPGKYTQIRLNVDSAKVTIDGTEHDLEISSGTVKLIKPFTLEEGKEKVLTLDFDAAESIHAAGKDSYRMRPTIKVIEE